MHYLLPISQINSVLRPVPSACAILRGSEPRTLATWKVSLPLMIERLRQAIALAEQRSEQEQEVLAALLLEEMQATERWGALFADPRSDRLLERLVTEALAEDAAGETEEIAGDTFLS